MNIESYQTEHLRENQHRFYSIGPRGKIELRIDFTLISEDIYNLAFGV